MYIKIKERLKVDHNYMVKFILNLEKKKGKEKEKVKDISASQPQSWIKGVDILPISHKHAAKERITAGERMNSSQRGPNRLNLLLSVESVGAYRSRYLITMVVSASQPQS